VSLVALPLAALLVVVSEGLPAKPEPPPAVIAADVVVDEIEEDEA